MSDAGALLFARYAYPPNELGYCGPSGAAAMLSASPAEIEWRARAFDGAWAYLEFLAAYAGVADPLSEEVVEAYWVGNALIDEPDSSDLTGFLRQRFVNQAGGTWTSADDRAVAHHSFHVFEVYPWATLLRRTGNPTAASVLDRCRIRTGVVHAVHGETATVASHPLTWAEDHLTHATVRMEKATWSVAGRSLLAGLSPGDRVALHWDWICDVLTEEQAGRVIAYEERQLRFLNSVDFAGEKMS